MNKTVCGMLPLSFLHASCWGLTLDGTPATMILIHKVYSKSIVAG